MNKAPVIYPIDLTPAARARLRLLAMFGLAGIFNAVLAALAYLTDFQVIDWRTLTISCVSQFALAVLEATRHYYSAHGDVPTSTLLDLARQEVASRVPPAEKLDANMQAIQQSINDLINTQAAAIPSVPLFSNLPTDLIGKGNAPIPAPDKPQAGQPDLSKVETVTTLPNIAAIAARQSSQQG